MTRHGGLGSLLVLLLLQLGTGVDHPDVQLLRALEDLLALLNGHSSGDLCAVLAVLHEEHLDILNIADAELLEAVGQHKAGLLVGAVADTSMRTCALETPTETTVNAARRTPCVLRLIKLNQNHHTVQIVQDNGDQMYEEHESPALTKRVTRRWAPLE